MWRLITLLILSFWGVMTWLLVDKVYLSAGQRVVVPMNLILDRATEAATQGEMMDLLQEKVVRGRASVRVQKWLGSDQHPAQGYLIDSTGNLDGDAEGKLPSLNWHITGKMDRQHEWHAAVLRLRLLDQDASVMVDWNRERAKPIIEVRKQGQVIMDMAAIEQQLALMKQFPALSSIPGMELLTKADQAGAGAPVEITSTTGLYRLAGEARDGFYITASALGLYRTDVLFTESGELARIDLPSGWQLTNPLLGALQ
jgi:hypothetical protein